MIPVKEHVADGAHIRGMEDYERLHAESLKHPNKFWREQAERLDGMLTTAKTTAPVVYTRRMIKFGDARAEAILIRGTAPEYQDVADVSAAYGRFFSSVDNHRHNQVCILGQAVVDAVFQDTDPLYQKIYIGPFRFLVIGVKEKKGNLLGFNQDEDVIIPIRFCNSTDPDEFGRYCMEGIDPDFPKKITRGDIIVAGKNFGCGSSREPAPISIKAAGIS